MRRPYYYKEGHLKCVPEIFIYRLVNYIRYMYGYIPISKKLSLLSMLSFEIKLFEEIAIMPNC